jgi:RNA polymerase sigma-70 factor (ECF subfamily)
MSEHGGEHFEPRAIRSATRTEFGEVLAAAQDGAHWAVAVLWQDLHPRLLRFLRGIDPVAAEDVEADTWLAAARHLAGFRGDDKQFRAWMFTIARNRLIDWRRREARQGVAVPSEALDGHPGDDDPAVTALDVLRAEATVARVRALLPRGQAEVILLRVLGGLDVAEVAAILDKGRGTVRVLQHRGLRRLAEHLAEPVPERRGVTT